MSLSSYGENINHSTCLLWVNRDRVISRQRRTMSAMRRKRPKWRSAAN